MDFLRYRFFHSPHNHENYYLICGRDDVPIRSLLIDSPDTEKDPPYICVPTSAIADIFCAKFGVSGVSDAEVKEWDIQCYSLCYTLATLARDMFCDRLCGQGFRLLLKTLNRDIVQNDLENMSVERFMSCVFARSKRDYYSERYPLFLKNSMQYYSELWAQIKETVLSLMSMNVEKMEAVTQGIALGMYMNESLEFEEFL
ncbi:MAG: hypothetical protein U0L18_06925 [Acutalibacteraceae bacterium]|nr:hypothetical protein [Acutalibacteraceae bacterium]